MPYKKYFQNPDLPGSDFVLPGNDIGILLIHGFTATTVEVRELAIYLNKKGCTISAPLLPGHGTTYQDLNKCKFSDWIRCAEQAYIDLYHKKKIVIVGGESMGAVLSLVLAQKYSQIKALLLYSTALYIKNINYAQVLSLFFDKINKKKSDDDMPWQGYTVYPLRALVEFRKLQQFTSKGLYLINQPTLICQGNLDRTIDAENANMIFSNISSKNKDLRFFEKSSHVMIMDKEKEIIFDSTYEFLQSIRIL